MSNVLGLRVESVGLAKQDWAESWTTRQLVAANNSIDGGDSNNQQLVSSGHHS